MESLWKKTVELPRQRVLGQDLQVQCAIVGGGMAGLLTALFLERNGVEAVVLEADRVAGGQTGNTTAKITAQHGMIYHKLLDTLGREKAQQYAHANQRAIEQYRQIAGDLGISCWMEELPAYLYSRLEEEPLRREADAAKSLGFDAAFTMDTTLPFPVAGAVRFENQSQFHPLEFLQGILPKLTVYEETPVLSVEGDALVTPGGRVTAEEIVFATHYPFLNLPGMYFARMHQERSYVIALEGAQKLDGVYYGVDEEGGWSMRNAGEYLLLGGGNHRTGDNRSGGKYRSLADAAKEFWPQSREAARWSAQDCMTLDGVPYIGQFAESTPNWYVATGFGKWGMTHSMVAAQLISDRILGRENPDWEVFSPQRFTPGASAKTFLENGLQAVKGLGSQLLEPPWALLKDLQPGHGGIVEWGEEKVGAYRDEAGEVFLVSTRCPHLGCQLEWNPDEKSWDCPCHGSRFDYKGNRIDGPAQTGLHRG